MFTVIVVEFTTDAIVKFPFSPDGVNPARVIGDVACHVEVVGSAPANTIVAMFPLIVTLVTAGMMLWNVSISHAAFDTARSIAPPAPEIVDGAVAPENSEIPENAFSRYGSPGGYVSVMPCVPRAYRNDCRAAATTAGFAAPFG